MPIDNSCLTCDKTFATIAGLRSHCRAKNHAGPFACDECDRTFASSVALEAHLNSPRHADNYSYESSDESEESDEEQAYCDSCNRSFVNTFSLNQHLEHSPMHNWCAECSRDFGSETSLIQHLNSSRHAGGNSYESSNKSEESEGSEDEPYCNGCNRSFVDTFSLNQHLAYSPKHNWCFECSRDFSENSSLVQHQNSLAHKGRDFECPFCESMFKSPSGIALHIESGCHKVTRHQVTAAVHRMKIVPDISIKRISGPATASNTTYIASEASWNGKSYACFLCKKKCNTLAALNSHLNSAAHDDDEFRCPKCKAEFKLISGFVQHLESRSCGLAKDKQVDKIFNDLSGQFSRLLKL